MLSRHTYSALLTALLALTVIFQGCSSTGSEDNNPVATFDSGNIPAGETFSYTFDKEGSVEYYCELHAPDMQGKITVSSSAEAVERDTVRMETNQFNPRSLTVAPGTEVVWINNEDHAHTVVSGNPTSGDDGSGGGY